MKGKLAHEIALLPLIAAALPIRGTDGQDHVFGRRSTGFSGYSDGKQKLDGRLKSRGWHLARWGLHDLRRTFSTRLHEHGVEPLVIEALLAHIHAVGSTEVAYRRWKRKYGGAGNAYEGAKVSLSPPSYHADVGGRLE